MAVTLQPVIRRDGFSRACVYKENGVAASVATLTIRAQVRDSSGVLVDELLVTKADQGASPGVFTIAANPNPPTDWPVDVLSCDIQFTDAGGIPRSTERILIPVVEDVTFDA